MDNGSYGKPFYEVFPFYTPQDQDIKLSFEDALVNRVVKNKSGSRIDVYFTSSHPVHKKEIYEAERGLERTLPVKTKVKFALHESFTLSSQYDLESLLNEYDRSILYELKCVSPILFSIYRNAEKKIDDNCVDITIADNGIDHDFESELKKFLYRVICERCGIEATINISYEKASPDRVYLERAADLKREIAAISSRAVKSESTDNPAKKTVKNTEYRKKEGTHKKSSFKKVKSDDPKVLFRYDTPEPAMPISDIIGPVEDVTIRGMIRNFEAAPTKSEKWVVIRFDLTDFEDTIGVRILQKPEDAEELIPKLKNAGFIKLCGNASESQFEKDLTIGTVNGIRQIEDFREKRIDTATEKRVELHCHTKMSRMDAVSELKDLVNNAVQWGWKSLAITDHGTVQAFPLTKKLSVPLPEDFKFIYGMEGYLVDDFAEAVKVSGEPEDTVHRLDDTFCVFDIETTGFSAKNDRIIEIGAVLVQNGKVVDTFDEFINPKIPIPYRIEKLTGINDNMVKDADTVDAVLPRFLEFTRNAPLVGHNATFDVSFIAENAKRLGLSFDRVYTDTMILSRMLLPKLAHHKLDNTAKELGVELLNHHRACDDAGCTAQIYIKFCEMLKEMGIEDLGSIDEKLKMPEESIKKLYPYHVILLAKNETGRVNLYRLVSMSYLQYFHQKPKIPRSELIKHREGLIIGSACAQGELYEAIMDGKSDGDIASIADFYDYLEIQPVGNNAFLLGKSRENNINSIEDLQNINRRIVELGEKLDKPVCATGDVHFTEPEDALYRSIILDAQKFEDADDQPPIYLRTTDDMLKEFEYLGSDKAYEVVVKNTNMIADMVEKISPTRPDKCSPKLENSDETLRKICYDKAHKIYGEDLPSFVTDRLETELTSIIGNGYADLYIIAQKLVWKSNEDGYTVGSRGSVGSSFVAYLAGITEVNSLPPHYVCPKCHYSEYDSEEVLAYVKEGTCGIDMADKDCPECGNKLNKYGFDIPFQTFLGFKGDKEPDIDLNFSSEYQSRAHKYTEEIFGKGHTFRAGTMTTVADKTAFGYVKTYFEKKGEYKRDCEIARVAEGCTGVLKTTGQHPGGIVVLPHGEEIHSFTPIQHPADKTEEGTSITTHFEYHSIEHNLLKLDILGHDDPTMIKRLGDMTGIAYETIPLDDEDVMGLFKGTESLRIKPSDIDGIPTGTMGIPEFGTNFVINMLVDAKPSNISDLVRISGLSHGTDVWNGNAEELIKSGTAELATCICCRDDIMSYLIGKGMDKQLSFKTMESVRKGKGLAPEMEQAMNDASVPDWYIGSCKKIKYMFPKAHAAAYVMMALRVGWYKVHYPLEYYSAFFSIRAKGFNYEKCCRGKNTLLALFDEYKKKDKLNDVEKNEFNDMRLVLEMYARGYEFTPIDLFKAHPKYCTIVDGKIMPHLSSVPGIGLKAAEDMLSRISRFEKTPFLSLEDFCNRSGASMDTARRFVELGILSEMPESNQLSLFDL
ncbi:MAG: PolC-type DNA polymerase III [Lachnospiraceae bacterium]|nr:PolC-type DNA polymerase III [Lachnospiraceae bacterium]